MFQTLHPKCPWAETLVYPYPHPGVQVEESISPHQGHPRAALHWGSVKADPSAEPQRAALGSPRQPGHLERKLCLWVLPTH